MLTALLATLALAGVPDGVTPAAAPVEIRAEYAAWLAETGRPPAELACDPLWASAALVCFKVVDGDKQRWVTAADLEAWGVNPPQLRQEVAARSASAPPPRREAVQGTRSSYWIADQGPWTLALALRPDQLSALVGTPQALVAVPADGVLIAWAPGDPDLDKIVAVAVHEAWESQQGPVTPLIHRWDGEGWHSFGQAVPSGE